MANLRRIKRHRNCWCLWVYCRLSNTRAYDAALGKVYQRLKPLFTTPTERRYLTVFSLLTHMAKFQLELNCQLDPDKVLRALGKYGKFQIVVYIIVNFVCVHLAVHMLLMAFVGEIPTYACRNVEEVNFSFINYTINNESCVEPDHLQNKCGTNRTEFVFQSDFSNMSIVNEWQLVCDKSFYASLSGSIYMFGVMVGSAVCTPFSDRYGRRWPLLICLWTQAILAVAIAFVPSYLAFVVLRFFMGLFNSGVSMIGWVVVCETLPHEQRYLAGILSGFFWSFGFVVLATGAYLIHSWRTLQLVMSVPMVLYILYYWILPESIHWLIVNKRNAEAFEWIKRAAKFNGTKVDIQNCLADKQTESDALMDQTETSENDVGLKTALKQLCGSPFLLLHAVVMCFLWFCNVLLYYGLSLYSTQLSGNKYINFCLSGLIEIPGYILVTFLLKYQSRRWSMVMFHVITALALYCLLITPNETSSKVSLLPLITTLSMVGKFCITCSFSIVFLYAAEIYPTNLRTIGCGASSVFSRLGGVLAPNLNHLAAISEAIVPTTFGTLSLIAALATLLLPETRNCDLPKTVEDVRPNAFVAMLFGKCRKNETVKKTLTETPLLTSNAVVM